MDKLVEKTLGEFLSDLIAAVAVGIFLLYLVGPIASREGADMPLPISPAAGNVSYLNWVVPLLMAYLLGELCIVSGSSLVSFAGAKLCNWKEPTEISLILAQSDASVLLNSHFRMVQKYHLLCGTLAVSVLGIFGLLTSLLNPSNQNAVIAQALSLSVGIFAVSGLTAVMVLRRMQQQCQ